MNRLQHFFKLPEFEGEDNRIHARTMYLILTAMIGFTVLLIVLALLTRSVAPGNLITLVALCFVFVGALWLLRRAYLRPVVWIFTAAILAVATATIYNVGTVYTPNLAVYLVAVTIVGLLVNTRLAFIFLVLTLMIMGGLAWAEGRGLLPPPTRPAAGPFAVIIFVGGFIVVVQYLTQRGPKEALGRARVIAAQQNAVLASAATGISLLVERKFVWTNPRMTEIFGYSEADLQGQNSQLIYPSPQDYEETGAEAYARLAEGERYYTERLMKHKDGSLFWCSFTGQAVNPADLSQGTIWLLEDITGRKRAEQERERLQQEIITAQQQTLKELSSPVIPVLEGVIVMPLIGSIDSLRARDITRMLLAGICENRARVVILDITGVPLVDSGVANHLNKTIQAARLKGARTIVTGISDAVAETIVDLGIDWDGVETLADLQTGLVAALHSLGLKLSKI